MRRLVLIVFFLEVGFVLCMAPWSTSWDRNYFAETLPHLRLVVLNPFVRGAVTGLGIVNLATGVLDLFSIFRERRDATVDVSAIAQHRANE